MKRTRRKSLKRSKRQLEGIRTQLVKGDLDALIAEYQKKPEDFLALVGKLFPPKLLKILHDIYFGVVEFALLVACRGGGKSQLLASLGATLYLFRKFDVLMLGGSAEQSKNDYNYSSEILTDNPTVESFSEDILTTVTTSKYGNWLKCLAASGKQVRGPHAGDPHKEMDFKPHGGALMIDEECEAKEEIVKGSMETVNTADPAVIIRASTFHKAVGTFQEALDKAAERGYTVYHWDCFDVSRPCRDQCEKCFVEFAGELHPDWPEYRRKHPDFEAYCQGKAKSSSGWMKIKNIKHFFTNLSQEDFEVEMMGLRPSAAGLVLNPNDVEACIVPDTKYMPGMPIVVGIDWGFKGMAALVVLQEQIDHAIAILDAQDFHLAPDQVLYDQCLRWREEFNVWEINPDASHPFQNNNLAAVHGFTVNEISFAKYKDLGAGALKGWTEKRRLLIPRRFTTLISQLKNWRKAGGKIVKKDDHYPDSLLAAAIKWAEQVPVNIEGQGTGQQREYTKAGGF